MRELTNPLLLLLKAALFVALGGLAATLLWIAAPRLSTVLLLAIAVWAFARAYYFAFYVLQRYVDPSFRFSGLFSAALFLWRRRRAQAG